MCESTRDKALPEDTLWNEVNNKLASLTYPNPATDVRSAFQCYYEALCGGLELSEAPAHASIKDFLNTKYVPLAVCTRL